MPEPLSSASPPVMAAIHHAAFGADCWDEASLTTLLRDPFIFGFIDEGGFILARAVADETEILTLAVSPGWRRQGHARVLLAAALAEASRRGARQAFLEVAEENRNALALYEGAGFIRSGRRADYYGAGAAALLLWRPLLCSDQPG
jgi:ribosomal-protein-alanine N-acetyltransferase